MLQTKSDENFDSTQGLALLWELAAEPNNIVFHCHQAELANMQYWDIDFRWPTVYGNNGTITITAPRPGSFYPAVMVYDVEEPTHLPRVPALLTYPPGLGSYEMSIDDEVVGRFYLREQDNRERLFFLDHPIEFKGGEKITFHTGPTGMNLTQDIFLLHTSPPIRKRPFDIKHIGADYTEIDGKPRIRLTWVTTWPTCCTVEYGDKRSITEPSPMSNHRVYLDDIGPGLTITYRIIAPKPDGNSVQSDDMSYTFLPPVRLVGSAVDETVTLSVKNPHDFNIAGCPVTSGVPFARGEIGDVTHLRLLNSHGKSVACQIENLAQWDDGSVKWAQISFQADAAADETAQYTLEYGTAVKPESSQSPLQVQEDGGKITVNTGPLQVCFDPETSGLPISSFLNGRAVFTEPVRAHLCSDGKTYDSNHPVELLEVEEAGPVRIVVRSKGHYQSDNGQSLFEYEARFVFYANAPFFRAHFAWGNDRNELFTCFDEIALDVPLAADNDRQWAVGLGQGKDATGTGELELRQMHHDSFETTANIPPDADLKRADGWVDTPGLMVAVREFWQQYPKAFSIKQDRLAIGLCPDVPDGTYDAAQADDITKFYFYLLKGQYKIKVGVKKWHELMFICHDDQLADVKQLQTVAMFQQPLIAVSPAQRYCDTGVFGRITPAGTGKSNRYDAQCEQLAERYTKRREDEAFYGMLNYGCVIHEGTDVWENGEYDHHHCFLLLFARTADPKWYFLAEIAARHFNDVDSVNYGDHQGAVHAHVIGHTGDYFDTPPPPYPKDHRKRTLWASSCHSWLEGFCDWYGVSGDRTALEKAKSGGDYYTGTAMTNNYDFSNLRESGWYLVLALGVYHLTYDRSLLNAMHIVAERVLEKQTPGPRGWHRQMMPAHCHCMPRHRGACIYMLAILCRGLETYYEITGDERIADAIVGGVDQAIDEMWMDDHNDFAPTSCPRVKEYSNWSGNYPHPVQMLLFAHLRTGKAHYLDIGKRLMEHSNRAGEDVAPWWTKSLYYLDQIERRKTKNT